MSKKKHSFITGRRSYVLNAKRQIFGDRRTKRTRDRSTRERKATEDSE